MPVLTIWTKDPATKVMGSIASVLPPDVKYKIVNDLTRLPDGELVLAMGSHTRDALEAHGKIRKKSTINSLRNQVHQMGSTRLIISYSPAIYEVDYSQYIDLLCDVRLAARIALTGSHEPVIGTYEYVSDFSAMIADIEEQYSVTGKPVKVCFDTETIGADPLALAEGDRPAARFVTWQFSHRVGYSAIKYFSSKEHYDSELDRCLFEQLKFLLTSPKISLRLANGKFDMMWVWFHARNLECTNFKFDTTLVGSLLDENRSNALDVHAKIYTGLGGYSDFADRTWDKSRMDLRYLEDPDYFKTYAGGDTDAGLQVAEAMTPQLLKSKKLTDFYITCVHPAARAFEVIERGGVFVDKEAYRELEADLRNELDKLIAEAVGILGGRLYAKHRDPDRPGGINLTKASLLTDFMFSPTGLNIKPLEFTEKAKKPSTSLDHLLKFKDHPEAGPFVRLLDSFSSTSKTLSTYIKGFQKHLRSDGRYHPSYFLFKGNKDEGEGGTVTGRLSARDPAIQTLPKHTKWGKRLRRVFTAPPGYLVLERDYSQGELRVVACLAEETEMLEAYRAGKDLHVKTGAGLVGMTYEEVKALETTDPDKYDKIRTPAKPANFGLLYGQGWEGFQTYAELNYGVILTNQQAQDIHRKFFEMYPKLVEYHQYCIAQVTQTGKIMSPLGRVRNLPLIKSPHRNTRSDAERQAINSPVQSTLSDMMIWALGIEHAQGGFKESPAFAVIHDAAYDYVPEGNVEAIVKRKRDLMENLPFEKLGWQPQLKFIADCKVGKNMADLSKVKP
jgi:DNA polymerase I-like protein with 3'-5' exonuclease and polymerase domains